MKKLLIYIFLLLSPVGVQGFLGEDLGIDLYRDIDEGMSALEENTYVYEVVGGQGNIKDEINRVLDANGKQQCIAGDISIDEFNRIVGGASALLGSKVSKKCWGDGKKISSSTLSTLQSDIVQMARDKNIEAKNKATNIYKTARVGLYTNASTDDSPFDLLSDLKAIDIIIFGEEFDYDGRDINHLDLLTSKQTSRLAGANISSTAPGFNESGGGGGGGDGGGGGGDGGDDEIEVDPGENICIDPSTAGNLSVESLEKIFGKQSSVAPTQRQIRKNTVTTEYSSSYSPYSDQWDCSGFFCVTVDYITYNHKLLGGGGDGFSIKKVIETSNEHVQKFANTSLLQSTHTTNNWENNLVVDDLPSMFNMSVVVQYKPAPIINTNQSASSDTATFGKQNMLEQAFNSFGLEYKRQNNMGIFADDHNKEKLVSLLNCGELTVTCVPNTIAAHNELTKNQQREAESLRQAMEQIGLYEGSESFFKLFTELDGFISGLDEYTAKLKVLAKKINDIP